MSKSQFRTRSMPKQRVCTASNVFVDKNMSKIQGDVFVSLFLLTRAEASLSTTLHTRATMHCVYLFWPELRMLMNLPHMPLPVEESPGSELQENTEPRHFLPPFIPELQLPCEEAVQDYSAAGDEANFHSEQEQEPDGPLLDLELLLFTPPTTECIGPALSPLELPPPTMASV